MPTLFIVLAVVVASRSRALLFSFIEHTRPIQVFRAQVARLAKGEIDALQPSRFGGAYKKIAADINDGVDKIAAKGGAPRDALRTSSRCLEPMPAQPQMSAFSGARHGRRRCRRAIRTSSAPAGAEADELAARQRPRRPWNSSPLARCRSRRSRR